ncbi:uncharacterized protein LOC124452538 [Xenia sp. Carnegie-2017]|uniref:uncharacterized protein LOC124452538 n=1 Tax=Xenia sp. Carnegie-2017 TaxID=2897299 RepID=UPI001F03F4EE|nr:uncharacterized protein LOC124452538 [Xenia sp. Carnegie-2017]
MMETFEAQSQLNYDFLPNGNNALNFNCSSSPENCNGFHLDCNSVLPIHESQCLRVGGMSYLSNWATTKPRPCKDLLQQAIRVKRIKKGQFMPVIDNFRIVPKKRRKPLQGEIPEDMRVRREKNREAAKKCRLKKRKVMQKYREKIENYDQKNQGLQKEIIKLKKEIAELQNLMKNHSCIKSTTQTDCTVVVHQNSSCLKNTTTQSDTAAVSLDDVLNELQDDDRWFEDLQQFIAP